jgi:hypothetical protein
MGKNADDLAKLQTSLFEGERAAHERTKERLYEVEAQLAAVHVRIERLMFDPPGTNPLDYPREV